MEDEDKLEEEVGGFDEGEYESDEEADFAGPVDININGGTHHTHHIHTHPLLMC